MKKNYQTNFEQNWNENPHLLIRNAFGNIQKFLSNSTFIKISNNKLEFQLYNNVFKIG